ncbi:hypothetical protein EVAR_84804_1 [Eumeta japonica]|uniref:Uncharacterized protein n=1 Tax=Eumeta variegata TaxID=151549 RepID=A0A4C1U9F9_EUMVA|nr:hypothetical protein EVAR_84804_1 [Eumeta japonica]
MHLIYICIVRNALAPLAPETPISAVLTAAFKPIIEFRGLYCTVPYKSKLSLQSPSDIALVTAFVNSTQPPLAQRRGLESKSVDLINKKIEGRLSNNPIQFRDEIQPNRGCFYV